MLFDYDDTNIESIYNYAKKLEGMTFQEILDEYESSDAKYYVNPKTLGTSVAEPPAPFKYNTKAKGQLGNFLEEFYFGYYQNSDQEPDFKEVGVELKATPIDILKNGKQSAGERLSITNVPYNRPVEDDFYKSHVWAKIKQILLIHYIRDKSKDRMDYPIKYVNLFTPPQDDLSIIIQDYLKIIGKIKAGKAHELSESDTLYLGACTKGSTALKSQVPQYYGDRTLAKKRNYCFKRQYMDYVLHEYVEKDKVPYESIVKNNNLDVSKSFEEQIVDLINKHAGQTDEELCKQYDVPYTNNKAMWTTLAYRMLGIKNNRAEEFIKANISVRIIRIETNGKNKESISLTPFKFKDLAKEEWEDSEFCNYFEETKFLFVIYKSNGTNYNLFKAELWNMPYADLYGEAMKGWQAIHDKIVSGVTFTVDGDKVLNDIPGMNDNEIIHMRPHANKSAYKLKNGYEKGNIDRDADELPDGQWMTKQSFWLNNKYILKQLKVGKQEEN